MFRSKFIVKKVSELRSGVKNERDASGAAVNHNRGSLKLKILQKSERKSYKINKNNKTHQRHPVR